MRGRGGGAGEGGESTQERDILWRAAPSSAPEGSVGKLPPLADEGAGDAQGSWVADWSTLAGAESLPLNLLFELARTAFIP